MDNNLFFEEVCKQQPLVDALTRFGFRDTLYLPSEGVKNDGLKFEKRSWFLPATGEMVERVCVHFESKRPGHICLHVEIDPYKSGKSIREGDPRLVTLAFQLRSKAALSTLIRTRIMGDINTFGNLVPSISKLGDTNLPNTNAPVKFERLGNDATPDECGIFFAEVVSTITPVVDQLIVQHLAERAKWL